MVSKYNYRINSRGDTMAFFTYEQKQVIYGKIAKRDNTKYKSGQVKKINRDSKGNIVIHSNLSL